MPAWPASRPHPSLRRWVVAGLSLTLVTSVLATVSTGSSSTGAVTLTTLSNRADLISGGDALVQVGLPAGTSKSALRLSLGSVDVTKRFDLRPNGRFEGVLTGLRVGANRLVARLPGGRGASLTITNHPIGGPVFAGPQIQPWTCQAGAKDAQCNQPTSYTYLYMPAGLNSVQAGVTGVASANAFQPYDPTNPPPPGSVATTTTTGGVTVPFIVREETGYIDRDQYAVATLWQPGKPWTPWAPQPQSNSRLVITHGASCDTEYQPATAPSVLDAKVLGAGFIVMSNALDNAGHNCNIVTQAESLVMTKEHVIDTYGPVRWTIGMGCSGGSLVQQQVANAYPGLYQGITPQCSYTDAWSSAMQYVDYDILLRYFKDPSRWDTGTAWTTEQVSEVIDHPNIGNPVTFTTVIPNSANPSRTCPGVPAGKTYDPKTNPGGVRCTLQDYMVNVFGKRSDGFANRAFGNVGIQYGLKPLRAHLITAAQFVDLNTNLGGLDKNDEVQPPRSKPDLIGLQRAYTTGAVDSANNLDKVAIIDLRGPDPGVFHDVYRTYAMRARLLRNFGTAANQVLWRGQAPIAGDGFFAGEAVLAMDKWLARVDADHRPGVPLSRKIIQDKPGDLGDRCTNGAGVDIPSTVCDATVTAYGTPRFAADEPTTDDVLQCRLKPMRKGDYPVTFTAEQWSRLSKAFSSGVCDYSRAGLAQRPALAWLTYQDNAGHVVYGGQPLGAPPRSVPHS
jgi:hypothetical protein